MHKPSLYSRASDVQRHDAKEVVNEYASALNLNSDGKQALLDVGCGSGDVLMGIIAPSLAQGFSRITGVDISPKMVEYSEKCYGHLEGVDFKQLNIETDHLTLEFHEQFDRVTSFYTLHWILDPKKAFENIFKSLRSNGDCLLVFLGSANTFDAYRALSKEPRWAEYTKGLDNITSPLLNHPHIGQECESLLEQVGFTEHKVEVKEKVCAYEGVANFKDNMKAINMFPLPPAEYEDYFDALCDCLTTMGLREKIPGTEDYRFLVNYRLVVIYARKGE